MVKKVRRQLELGKVTIATIGRQEQNEVKGGTSYHPTLNPLNYDCNPFSEAPVICPPARPSAEPECTL